MNWISLAFYSIALTLAMAGIALITGKSLIKKRIGLAALLCLTTLIAVALVVYLASLSWSPR